MNLDILNRSFFYIEQRSILYVKIYNVYATKNVNSLLGNFDLLNKPVDTIIIPKIWIFNYEFSF